MIRSNRHTIVLNPISKQSTISVVGSQSSPPSLCLQSVRALGKAKNFIGLLTAGSVFLFASLVSALDIKPIFIESGFNEPLDATLEITDVRRRARLSVSFWDSSNPTEELRASDVLELAVMRVSVERKGGGIAEVRLTSRRPVQQARIDFIIQVQDRRGNQARRHILRALPGVFVAGARNGRNIDRSLSFLQANQGAIFELGIAGPEDVVNTADYSNLWTIAMETRAGYGVSVYQTMVAILDTNLHAFGYGGEDIRNVNYLKSNRELRIPNLEVIRSYDRASSIVQVAEMNYRSNVGTVDPRALRKVIAIEGLPTVPSVVQVDSFPTQQLEEIELPAWARPAEEAVFQSVPEVTQQEERSARQAPTPQVTAPTPSPIPQTQSRGVPVAPSAPAAPVAEESSLLYILVGGGAVVLLLIIIVIMRRSSGGGSQSDNQDSVANMLDLATAYVGMNEWDKAVPLLDKVLEENSGATSEEMAQARDMKSKQQQQ